jgi:hypothetical protein
MYAQKSWCPTCGNERIRQLKLMPDGLQELQRLASERGGALISTEYVGTSRLHRWRCAHDHQWEARPSNIKRGNWCPHCSGGLGERITRAFFEQIFEREFARVRPDWLRSTEGTRLELDGYCEELRLAFEHQGRQHEAVVILFGGTDEKLQEQLARDDAKRAACAERGIRLVEIPEVPRQILVSDLRDYIIKECEKKNVSLPDNARTRPIDLVGAYAVGPLQRLRAVAEEQGGILVSEHFKGYNERHQWQCGKGHVWEASASSVVYMGTWCPHCAGNVKYSLQQAQSYALDKGGMCLSEHYTDARTPLRWWCKEGHTWLASFSSVVGGSWCPACAGQERLTIEE